MKIRVISDLHMDVNEHFPFSLKGKEKGVFTLIAGDVSGNVKLTEKWVKQNIRSGMFVVGNHDPAYNKLGWTIQKQKQFLADKFTPNSNITFLDEQVGNISKAIPGTNILVVGTTLYTDYKYMSETQLKQHERINMGFANLGEKTYTVEQTNKFSALRGLNDFRWGHVPDSIENEKQRYVNPDDYNKWFDSSLAKMQEVIESNPDKDIIVLTHHCPSPKCICSDYVESKMNSSYVSDLEEFVRNHKNIKAWCCGHVHSRTLTNFWAGGPMLVCNPRGYESHFEATNWSPNTFIDTDTWTIEVEEYKNPKLKKAREEAREKFLKYAAFFI